MNKNNIQLTQMIENYESTLRSNTGYNQYFDIEKINLSKAKTLLSDLEEQLGTISKKDYASRITDIAEHMGMKKEWVDNYMCTQYTDRTTFCLPHALNAIIVSYDGKLDKVA